MDVFCVYRINITGASEAFNNENNCFQYILNFSNLMVLLEYLHERNGLLLLCFSKL